MISYNNKVLKINDLWLTGVGHTPPTPVLPANTVRVRTNDGNPPDSGRFERVTLVEGTTDVYDVYKSGTSFEKLFYLEANIIEVLDANTTGITDMTQMFMNCSRLTTVPLFDTSSVTSMLRMFSNCPQLTSVPMFNTANVTNMEQMFAHCSRLTSVPLFDTSSVTNMSIMFLDCTSLTSVPLFDTSSVTSMGAMFSDCTSLTSVPLFNTSSVTNMNGMFNSCTNVESGALALYQQASTQTTPPSNHQYTFRNCGSNTTTGAAELAQIPSDWK